jgi:tetratricopeptide (TPR) repeat protein
MPSVRIPRIGKPAIALSSSAVVLLLALAAARADVVRLVSGSTVKSTGGQISGQIISETTTEVKIKSATSGEQTIPVDQIESVNYDGVSPTFQLATTRSNAGSLAEAAELFQKAAGEVKGKPFLERAAAFGRAEALGEIAAVDPTKRAQAVEALESFAKSYPGSRQLGAALISLVRLRLSEGDTAGAEAALRDLEAKVPWAVDRAAVLKARVLAKKGENEAAISALDALISASPAGSVKSRDAKLAKAESLAALKKFSEAEALVREVIAEAPAEEKLFQAVAHNTLGDCLRAAGRPKDALLAYLKTDILYSDAKDEHARALAHISDLWRLLKQSPRADEAKARLRDLYPRSPYVNGQ